MTFANIKKTKDQGFTIVELLIVIIVIGILATLVLIAYNNVQGQARDTKRQADANSIGQTSETYKTASTLGYYPDMSSSTAFQADINTATNYSSGTKVVSLDASISSNLTTSTPAAGSPNAIKYTWCGTPPVGGSLDRTNASGVKFSYWSESKKAVQTTTTGTGC